jgi:hypothetical protein
MANEIYMRITMKTKNIMYVMIALSVCIICPKNKLAYGDGSCGYIGNDLCHSRKGCGKIGCGPNCQQYNGIEASELPDMWIVSDDGQYSGPYEDSSQLRMNCWRTFVCKDALDSVCDTEKLPPTCIADPNTYSAWRSVQHKAARSLCQ